MLASQILPVSQPASPARRTKDYWEHMPELGVCVHHHLQPRKKFQDKPKDDTSFRAGTHRLTVCEPCQTQDEPKEYVHDMESQNPIGFPFWWTGSTYFVDKSIQEPSKVLVVAKKIRDKSGAKKAARHKDLLFLMNLSNTSPSTWQRMSTQSNMTCDNSYNNILTATLN